MRKIRIVVADDHALMRVGLRSMLVLEDDMDVVGEASNGKDAVRLADELHPDVIIMDLMMPLIGGAEATRKIHQDDPKAKIIILTSYGSSDELLRAVSNGAVGVQPKEDPTENLIKSIRKVVRGETAFPAEIQRMLAAESSRDQLLTDKQIHILRMVARGFSGKQIADTLEISESGVKKHLQHICAKIGAANRTEAVTLAIRKGLLRP